MHRRTLNFGRAASFLERAPLEQARVFQKIIQDRLKELGYEPDPSNPARNPVGSSGTLNVRNILDWIRDAGPSEVRVLQRLYATAAKRTGDVPAEPDPEVEPEDVPVVDVPPPEQDPDDVPDTDLDDEDEITSEPEGTTDPKDEPAPEPALVDDLKNVDPRAIELVKEAGFTTQDELREFCRENDIAAAVSGIGPKFKAELHTALGL